MEKLPDKMTGKDLVVQETYEASLERQLVDRMDRVDRRDKRNEIKSGAVSNKYRSNYDQINWGSR